MTGVEFYADNNMKAKGVCHLFEGIRRESFFLPRLRILDLTSKGFCACFGHR